MLTAALFTVPAGAGMSIKVLVNNDPITSYDISQRAKLMKLTSRISGARATKAATNELIEETLQLQEAEKRGISISKSRVDQAFATIAERVKLSPKKLEAALKSNGVDPRTLKSRLKAQLGWNEIVGAASRRSNSVSEQEVIAALQADKSRTEGGSKEVTEYDVAQVTFVVRKNAGKKKKDARRREMTNLASRFTSCEEGLAVARKLPNVVVKQLGKRLETELPRPMIPLVQETSVGGLSKPVETQDGFAALAVCGKEDVKSSAAAVQELTAELSNKDAQLKAQRYMRTLRRNAMIVYK